MRFIAVAVVAAFVLAFVLASAAPRSNYKSESVYVCGSKSMDILRNGGMVPKVSICRNH